MRPPRQPPPRLNRARGQGSGRSPASSPPRAPPTARGRAVHGLRAAGQENPPPPKNRPVQRTPGGKPTEAIAINVEFADERKRVWGGGCGGGGWLLAGGRVTPDWFATRAGAETGERRAGRGAGWRWPTRPPPRPGLPLAQSPPPSPLVPWLEVLGCALGINYERLEHDPILSAGSGVLPLQQTTTNNNKHTHDCSLVGWIDRPSSQACLLVLSV